MNDREKWAYLAAIPRLDARHPGIVRLAMLCLELAAGDRWRAVIIAHAVAGRAIKYQLDTPRTGGEDIAGLTRQPQPDDAIDAWRRGVDDCDAKARLFVAILLNLRVPARMAPIWSSADPDVLEHVYAEAFRGGRWLPVELTASRAVIGEFPRAVPKESDGKWLET